MACERNTLNAAQQCRPNNQDSIMGKNEYKREGFDLFDPFIVECFSSFLYTHIRAFGLSFQPMHTHTYENCLFMAT